MDRARASYPTFLGLGAPKAGTTLLNTWLADHPDVCVPATRKEIEFFSRYYERGWDWYRAQFQPASETAIGEISVDYLGSEQALTRIARDLPGVKSFVSLRDPVTRFDSAYRHVVRTEGYRGDRRAFMRERPHAIERGRYAAALASLLEKFPAEQVKVLVFEEVVARPREASLELYGFLGVASHTPSTLTARVNPGTGLRLPRLERIGQGIHRFATERDLRWALKAGRSAPVRRLRGLNASDSARRPPPMDARLADELRVIYAEDVEETSSILGRDLSRLWPAAAEPVG